MIFVTVGTHEQPFLRLINAVENLETDETKIIQYGYSYPGQILPGYEKFMDFDRVRQLMREAKVTITHGGTGSVINALSLGCPLVVAPRYQRYGEHIDDHQLELVHKFADDGLIVPYYDTDQLQTCIENALKLPKRHREITPDNEMVKQLRHILESSKSRNYLRWLL